MGRLSFKLPWAASSPARSPAPSPQLRDSASETDGPLNATPTASVARELIAPTEAGGPHFYVEIEDPHRMYSPGATVSGRIVLLLGKKQKVSSVKVDVHGFVHIKNLLLSGRSGVTKDLCRSTIDLWSAEDATNSSAASASTSSSNSDTPYLFLPPGEHRFPFEFSLPASGLLSSLTFERGNISYLVTGILKRPGRGAQTSPSQPLSVTVPLDVSLLPPAKITRIAIDVTQRRRSAGPTSKVVVQLELPTKGYIRGEEIPVQLTIKHQWLVQNSAGIILTLVRIARLHGADLDAQTFRKDLDQVVLPLYTDPKTLVANVVGTLRVPPDSFPTMRHKELVTFQYVLEMTMDVTGKRDLQKYVARDPAFTLIDTIELKQKSGIVSAWTEVIIGTSRTTLGLDSTSRVSQSHATLSERSVHMDLSSLSSSAAPSPSNTPPSALQSANEEKAELAAREAALLPSMPPMPPMPAGSHEVSAPGSVGASFSPAGRSDKQELERSRLADLASAPEDFVPRYEASAPAPPASAPSAPAMPSAPAPSAAMLSAPSAPPMPSAVPSAVPSAPPTLTPDPETTPKEVSAAPEETAYLT